MISETERLILHGIKHIIERETFWTPEIRKDLDSDICKKITDYLNPIQEEEPCCEMPEREFANSGGDEK